jgi:hypothetical protein
MRSVSGTLPFYNVKKILEIFPSPARESLIGDIPAGNGKIARLFFTVYGYIKAKLTLSKATGRWL